MKVLVIDDKAANREAAKQTITGHELTIVGSWDEAVKLLEVRYDEQATKAKLVAAGFPATSDKLEGEARRKWYDEYYKVKETCRVPYWDAVLSDLLMPASRESMGGEGMKFVGQEIPVGLVLALLAAKNGAKYVAVVTATNHHHHPASAMLDRLGSAYWDNDQEPNFVINGAKAMFVHAPFIPDPVKDVECYNCLGGTACGYCRTKLVDGKCPRLHEGEGHAKPCHVCHGKGKHDTHVHERKHWGKVLARLLGEPVTDEESAN
jgi:CheY-like chemotaxis protein